MLALMALLSGAFLVFSAQSLSVARRRSQFALLRVLGVNKRALLAQVLAEGLIVGVIGAGLGDVLRDAEDRRREAAGADGGRRGRGAGA